VICNHQHLRSQDELRRDAGFTLVEMLIVIVILGILAGVTIFAVRAITDRGENASCKTDERVLEMAVESYFAMNDTTTLPGSGGGDDRYERGLVDAQVLRQASVFHDVSEDGTITQVPDAC